MKIVYKTFSSEEKVTEQINKWIENGHNLFNKFIKIVHTGDYYTIFYPSNLDEKLGTNL
jgi:hypothetical protein